MTLNVGEHFTARWLSTPDTVRTTYIADLERICRLLEPNTVLSEWQTHNHQAQQESQQRIDETYTELKKQRLEKAKQQEQQRREQNLAQQRQYEQEQHVSHLAHEKQRQEQQRITLNNLKNELITHTLNDTNRALVKQKSSNKKQQQAIENMNILLELEAEGLANKLKQVVSEFTQNLHQATQEEIKLSLVQMTQATHTKK
ncbi:hypothetical protein I2F27_00195 [Acinetobacter sp. B5B]|uniref:hypothetical protein n=1 Tax=Acinetobacter baretiae TaxID=2605383 RepID=UPI0018C219B7|nr:hypothetical protein [Acinetobacter baretiae]MBF7681758.1 hypothetical protein [Acinetobacter baretiae]MBF7685367.1 hypothetical protein [Acinetobacter baretiae]